jgi:hypothetical protein
MQVPIDTELVSAGVYLVAVPLYGWLWHRHSRYCYAALSIAALILALCALLRSETVRTWEPLHHHEVAPHVPVLTEDFSQSSMGRSAST